ncbi:MAG: hypothetical protein J2P44_12035 [Candidatus Dormibacteraeota bacterium]|nr:hypothetical protein [Candidatus Dormibacteraeota bacterium]
MNMHTRPGSNSHHAGGAKKDAKRAPRPPLWVILCGVAFLALLVVFVVIVATHSAGSGGHGLGFTGI